VRRLRGDLMAKKPTTKPLSERERRFVEAYVGPANGVGAAAAKAAGYKGNAKTLTTQAQRMLAKASIQRAIADFRSQVQEAAILTATEVAVWLSGVVTGQVTEKKVISARKPAEGKSPAETDDFVEIEQPFDGKARITACGLLMKKQGYEAPSKTELSGTVAVEVALSPEQDEALMEWLIVRDDEVIKARIAELRGEG
jgi:phage terminase small subunit